MQNRWAIEALQKIAYGHVDNGQSLSGLVAMSIARCALWQAGIDWSRPSVKLKARIELGPPERKRWSQEQKT